MCKRIVALLACALLFVAVLPLSALAKDITPINLALSMKYSVVSGEPITNSYLYHTADGINYNVDNNQLTDGKKAPQEESDDWYRAYSGKSRIVTIDLGSDCSVSGVKVGFLQIKSKSIYAPRYIKVSLSENGSDFQLVSEYDGTELLTGNMPSFRYDAEISFKQSYVAQYVKLELCVDECSYFDEIEVIGMKALSGEEQRVKPDEIKTEGGYIGSAFGESHIVKLYNGYCPEDSSVGVLTEAEVLPYVAYINAYGEIAGRMFGAVILAPCDSVYPSGGRLNGGGGAVKSDFEHYFENTFALGQNLDAVNKAAGKVNKALGEQESYPVFLAIPYPAVLNRPFGDIDGDGTEEYCRTPEERAVVAKWYIDKCVARFKENNYANLTLAGFCWNNNSVKYQISDDLLIKEVNSYVHKLHLESILSSAYLGSGFGEYVDLGFDSAVMQTELFDKDYTPEMLSEFASTVYNNRLGVELQIGDYSGFLSEDDKYLELGYRFESQLYYGRSTAYINALNVYEQGVGPGIFYELCYADSSTPKGVYLRRLYDLVFRYINGNYNNIPPVITVSSEVEMVFGDTQIMIDLAIEDVDSHRNNLFVEFPVAPSHGKVTASSNQKTLIYNVDPDFIGTDSFVVCVTDGFNVSENITVNIVVAKPENPNKDNGNGVVNIPKPLEEQTTTPLWVFIMLGLLAFVMVMVAIVTVVRPSRKETE